MTYGMQGLLPPRQISLQAEIDKTHMAIARCCTPLEKYQVNMTHHTPCNPEGVPPVAPSMPIIQ